MKTILAITLFCSLANAQPIGPVEQIKAGQQTVNVPLGVYSLTETLKIPSQQTILCQPGAVFEAAPGAFTGTRDCLVEITGSNNTVIGCTFRMRKADYGVYAYPKPGYVPSEFRHALNIVGARNVTLIGVRAEQSGGDGLFIGPAGTPTAKILPENITVKDSVFHGNLRNAVSVIAAKNLLIQDCIFSGTYGTSPQAGIDLEPEYRDSITAVIRRCQSNGNRGAAYMIGFFKMNPDDPPSSIVFEDCTYKDVPADQINFRLGGVLNHEVPNGYMRDAIPKGSIIQWNDLVWRK
jgi:hypothetical protein